MHSMRRTGSLALLVVAPWLPESRVIARQDGALRPMADAATEADCARLLGLLLYTKVNVQLDEAPAREAVATLSRLTQIPIKSRWCDDAIGLGIDPQCVITLTMTDEPALDVLEAMLGQCVGKGLTDQEECTWQLRRGFVEIGTKERLSVAAARETRIYELRDLMHDAPWFSSDDNLTVRLFRNQNPQNHRQRARKDDKGSYRKSPQHMAVDVIAEICETIEPGRWDYGQEAARPDNDRVVPLPEGGGAAQPPADSLPTSATPPSNAPAAPAVNPLPPRSETGVPLWASVRLWGDRLIVVAPDFIHRQIGGYPTPQPPHGIDTDEEAGD